MITNFPIRLESSSRCEQVGDELLFCLKITTESQKQENKASGEQIHRKQKEKREKEGKKKKEKKKKKSIEKKKE